MEKFTRYKSKLVRLLNLKNTTDKYQYFIMGKGKKERSKKNKIKKETREPIKREFESTQIALKYHWREVGTREYLNNRGDISETDRQLYEIMFK